MGYVSFLEEVSPLARLLETNFRLNKSTNCRTTRYANGLDFDLFFGDGFKLHELLVTDVYVRGHFVVLILTFVFCALPFILVPSVNGNGHSFADFDK